MKDMPPLLENFDGEVITQPKVHSISTNALVKQVSRINKDARTVRESFQ